MSRTLKLAVMAVLVYVTYHTWVVRQSALPPDPSPKLAAPSAPAELSPPPPPSSEPSPPIPAGQHATVPAPVSTAAFGPILAEIHEMIAQGDDHAEARLRAVTTPELTDPELRAQVAGLWNNLGVARAKRSGPAAGVAAVKTAVTLSPAHRTANMNLTQMYWELKDPGLTADYLDRMIALAPDHPLPHLVLADLLYDRDDLARALEHFDLAKRQATDDPDIRAVIEYVSAKVKRLERVEHGFVARSSEHFKVKFHGDENYEIWNRVLEILEDAYRDIGQQLGHFPRRPVLVVLHTRETFPAATGGPAWADGLFDKLEGRIKIPTQGALTDQAWLTRVLRHEFVHALVHDRLDGRLTAVPQWLNEGLAMQLSGETLPDLSRILRGPVISLSYLEGNWSGLSSDAAMLAYVEGNSATRYLIDRYGLERVRGVLTMLATGQPFASAFESGMLISYAEFQRRWVESVSERL